MGSYLLEEEPDGFGHNPIFFFFYHLSFALITALWDAFSENVN